MPEKIVYDPKERASNQKNAATKKPAKNPKAAAPTETKKKNEKDVVDAKAHTQDGADVESDEPVTQFKAKINKYGFLHVPKKAWLSLPFRIEQPLTARIDGNHLIIVAATESQPEKGRPRTEKT